MLVRRMLIAGAAAAVVSAAMPGGAQMSGAPSSALEVKKDGAVSYVSGGAGDEEQRALEQAARDFNLKVTFASPTGAYGGGGRLQISDASGKTVLDADARGPLFYAQLPPGKYTVTALDAGGQKKSVDVGAGSRAQVQFNTERAEREPAGVDPRAAGK